MVAYIIRVYDTRNGPPTAQHDEVRRYQSNQTFGESNYCVFCIVSLEVLELYLIVSVTPSTKRLILK